MFKRLSAIVLAGLLVFCMASSAFAEDTADVRLEDIQQGDTVDCGFKRMSNAFFRLFAENMRVKAEISNEKLESFKASGAKTVEIENPDEIPPQRYPQVELKSVRVPNMGGLQVRGATEGSVSVRYSYTTENGERSFREVENCTASYVGFTTGMDYRLLSYSYKFVNDNKTLLMMIMGETTYYVRVNGAYKKYSYRSSDYFELNI